MKLLFKKKKIKTKNILQSRTNHYTQVIKRPKIFSEFLTFNKYMRNPQKNPPVLRYDKGKIADLRSKISKISRVVM